MAPPASATPHLNWKELELLIRSIQRELEGEPLFVDRMVVPERARFSQGYLKGEWALRLAGRRSEKCILFSIRPRHPYIACISGKGPKAAPEGTHSAFDLALNKKLRGSKFLGLEIAPKERTVMMWFKGLDDRELGLILNLVPASPEALLVSKTESEKEWPILTRSRFEKEREGQFRFLLPDGSRAPDAPPVRAELVENSRTLLAVIEKALTLEAFESRLKDATSSMRSLLKQAQERLRQSETAIREAQQESDWQRYGDLLKSVLGNPPPISSDRTREIEDYESGEKVKIPSDPQLNPSEQVKKFYHLARRKNRRVEEATSRLKTFSEARERIENHLARSPVPLDWTALEKLETLTKPGGASARGSGSPKAGKPSKNAWLGKTFTSRNGWTILVGRSKDENLELTFKHARGNDLWMHIRGRPGAHVVIPVQPGKSVPLETLLDGAALAVHYSGGDSWGKTEVDYTFKKHVKRIKDSTEASYTQNKTLLVEPDPERMKRLQAT